MTMMVYPGPDGHHAGIFDGASGSGGRADMYREPVSGRAVPIAVQLEHDTPPVDPEITRFSSVFRPLSTQRLGGMQQLNELNRLALQGRSGAAAGGGSTPCIEGSASGVDVMAPALQARKALPEVGLEIQDVDGHIVVVATHAAAYDDEQAVTISVTNEEGILYVNWADAETVCNGVWNASKFRFDGHVKQRLQANEPVIFHATEVATHTFTLIPQSLNGDMKKTSELFSETTEALISYRQRTYVALQTCLRRITAALLLTGTQEMLQLHTIDPDNRGPHTEKQQLLWSMRSLRWGDLLSEYCRVSAERLCALLRLRADQLDRLSFQNPGDREAFKRRWEEERCIAHLRLDTAWKRAEKRVSDEELDMYEVSLQEISDEEVCIICQSDICLDSAVVIRLRCSHMFIALV
ncbi:hypothetical protein THAOC_22617 [Thalassiosira oceanica]|uniref:Uncharacterized protein n=1 Tax=Thalassiosira oceanica TaxID=159749 RepID=K0RU23_THAOC|nr:hypothetical protein THAOC_22617 [Thalassiosira oceanica]|eukprot:EJK57348.1 hypothetical protein THAOC_22617 [Thalassiosira oceanica]